MADTPGVPDIVAGFWQVCDSGRLMRRYDQAGDIGQTLRNSSADTYSVLSQSLQRQVQINVHTGPSRSTIVVHVQALPAVEAEDPF